MSFKDKGYAVEISKEYFESLLRRPEPRKEEEDRSFKVQLYEEKVVVPCEVEIASDLHNLIELSLLADFHCSFEDFVTARFIQRMQQHILTHPEEFGKFMLEPVLRSDAMLHNFNELFSKYVSFLRKEEQVIRK